MFTYLRRCGIYSLLFSSCYWVSIPCWLKDTRLISDKTKINNCFSSHGHCFSLGIRLRRLTIPWSTEFIQGISFFYFLRSLRGIIFYFGFLSYPKLCSWFFNEQKQLLMRLHPLRNKVATLRRPHPVMNERQLTNFRGLKIHHVLIFLAGSSSIPIMIAGLPPHRDTHC